MALWHRRVTPSIGPGSPSSARARLMGQKSTWLGIPARSDVITWPRDRHISGLKFTPLYIGESFGPGASQELVKKPDLSKCHFWHLQFVISFFYWYFWFYNWRLTLFIWHFNISNMTFDIWHLTFVIWHFYLSHFSLIFVKNGQLFHVRRIWRVAMVDFYLAG